MIEIPTIETCPIARKTQGIIEIEPDIIAELAGAARDSHEWLAVLLGERDNGGLHVIVSEFYVPPNQKRTSSTCEIPDNVTLPSKILPYIVGVVHSHHKMGARFSSTDRAPDGLNSNFPSSIVISSSYSWKEVEAYHLGFDYEAEMRFNLPCGALGIASAKVVPLDIEDWPHKATIIQPPTTGEHKSLGDCDNYRPAEGTDRYYLKRKANCGLTETDIHVREFSFGYTGDSITSMLPPVETNYFRQWVPSQGIVKVSDSKDDDWTKYLEDEKEFYDRLAR